MKSCCMSVFHPLFIRVRTGYLTAQYFFRSFGEQTPDFRFVQAVMGHVLAQTTMRVMKTKKTRRMKTMKGKRRMTMKGKTYLILTISFLGKHIHFSRYTRSIWFRFVPTVT